MFVEAGLDPEKPPQTWDDVVEYATKLVRRENGEVTRWGLQIPIDQWLILAFVMQNGGTIANESGTEIYLNTPEAIEAVQFLVDLVQKHNVMPARRLFGDAAADFVAGETAMMYNSTGNLTFVRNAATFDWGVAYLPYKEKQVVPTGGGNFVIFKGVPEERQKAAWEYIKWMTSAENAAYWSIQSGYVAVRKDAFDLPIMQEYTKEVPEALVARDQLLLAGVAEQPATYQGRRISQSSLM